MKGKTPSHFHGIRLKCGLSGGRFARIALVKGGSNLNATHNHKDSTCFVNSYFRIAICGMWKEHSHVADSARSPRGDAGADSYAGANPDTASG